MIEISKHYLTKKEEKYIRKLLGYFCKNSEINDIWSLMDIVWRDLKCDQKYLKEKNSAFYLHPVKLSN